MYLTAIMGRRDKKIKKNNANPEYDPQEVQNDEASEQYVFHNKTFEKDWHKTLRELPPGQTVDIPYLKTLDTCCPQGDIDQVTNFKPAYLARVTKCFWEVYDDQFYNIDKFYWDEGNGSLLNKFGTAIQNPEDHFVQYFGGTKPTLIEKGSPCCSHVRSSIESIFFESKSFYCNSLESYY